MQLNITSRHDGGKHYKQASWPSRERDWAIASRVTHRGCRVLALLVALFRLTLEQVQRVEAQIWCSVLGLHSSSSHALTVSTDDAQPACAQA